MSHADLPGPSINSSGPPISAPKSSSRAQGAVKIAIKAGDAPASEEKESRLPFVQKVWRFRPLDVRKTQVLQRECGLPAITALLLQARGYADPDQARKLLACHLKDLREPSSLPGAMDAAKLLSNAVNQQERIVIYGDYDVDGMTAVAILYRCLKMLGANVHYHVPSRLDDGYGLNTEALHKLAQAGARWIVTVDCGITSVQEALVAKELGLRLIITDHHTPGDALPTADAIVHPGLPTQPYPFPGLCGAGVAMKLAWALCQVRSGDVKVLPQHREFLLQAVGLAALATIADVVPLTDENRLIVRHGLPQIVQRPVTGLKTLLQVTQLAEKPTLQSDDVAFALAPRLNAAGRLGQAQLGVELLITENEERAAALAVYLNELNSNRDSLERSVQLAASKQLKEQMQTSQDTACVLADRGWHVGVIGLVAGRLAEKHHKPVVVIALDEMGVKPGVGSARSIPGLNLHNALAACRHRLVSFGGHAAAAGLKIEESQIDSFRAELCEQVASLGAFLPSEPELWIDAEIPFAGLSEQVLAQIDSLGPFGNANPKPVFCTRGVTVLGDPKRIGGGGRHLSLTLTHAGVNLRTVAFGSGERELEFKQPQATFDIAYRPILNEFRGRKSVEVQLIDWRIAETAVS